MFIQSFPKDKYLVAENVTLREQDVELLCDSNGWRRINGPLHISSIFRSKYDIDS